MRQSASLALFALLAGTAFAAPVINKRGLVVVTEWDVVTQTAEVTETIWVTAGYTPFPLTTSEIASSSPLTSSQVELASSTVVLVAPTTSIALTSTLIVLRTTTSQDASPSIISISSGTSPLPLTTTTLHPIPTAEPIPNTTSSILLPSSSIPAPPTTTSFAAAPTAGLATAGTSYTGDLTYYATGLGSCGLTSGSSDAIVAVSHFIMDVYNPGNPNNNPLCGRDVTITFGGEEFQAKVVDTCEGCAEGDLDLSEGFFSEVTGGQMSRGRIGGVQWKWT